MNSVIQCINLCKTFRDTAEQVTVLKNLNFKVQQGDKIAIIGPSGAGKSTFLHLLGGLEQPSSGEVTLMEKAWQPLSEKERCQLRNQHLGFIYQFHHLLPEFTAFENVAFPLLLAKCPFPDIQSRVTALLEAVGLAKRLHHKPAQLSGGERQRVAIARALIHRPDCLLADEPTGNLDMTTAKQVFQLMLDLNTHMHTACVIVTHDLNLAQQMDQCYQLVDGQLTRA